MNQDPHTTEVKTVRAICNATGVTRSQARFALHKAVGQASLEAQSRRFLEAQKVQEKPQIKVDVVETKSSTPVAITQPTAPVAPVAQPQGNGLPAGYSDYDLDICGGTITILKKD